MEGVLLGFGVVLIIVAIGYVAAALLPGKAAAMQQGLGPAVYYITNPALMLMLLAETDLGAVAGVYAPVALLTALAAGAVYALGSVLVLRRGAPHAAVGAMASSYVNAGNIGLPIALYAVGSSAPVVSVLIAQLLVVAPLYLSIFAWCAPRAAGEEAADAVPLWRTVLRSVGNPVTLATLAGAGLSLSGWQPPEVVWTPIEMLGHASIPLLLMMFGMSMRGQRPFTQRSLLPDLVWASFVKLAVMPVAAWAVARFAFGLQGMELLGVVVMAALPTAQNVFLFSSQFRMPSTLARDVSFLSSVLSLPAVLLAVLLLG